MVTTHKIKNKYTFTNRSHSVAATQKKHKPLKHIQLTLGLPLPLSHERPAVEKAPHKLSEVNRAAVVRIKVPGGRNKVKTVVKN